MTTRHAKLVLVAPRFPQEPHGYSTPSPEAVEAIAAIRIAARKLETAFGGSFVTEASRMTAQTLADEILAQVMKLKETLK